MFRTMDTLLVAFLAALCLSIIPTENVSSSEGERALVSSAVLGNTTHCVSRWYECSSEEGDMSCPPGLLCVDGHCECRSEYPNGLLKCDNTTLESFVLRLFCATSTNESGKISVGHCLHGKRLGSLHYNYNSIAQLFNKLPSNVTELQHTFCEPLNRTGQLCGDCMPDTYPLAYSFDTNCVACSGGYRNWVKYILAAYLPLTLFYIFILFFKVNITSSHLFAVVFACQYITRPFTVQTFLYSIEKYTGSNAITITGKVLLSIYGVWNLDFFRPFYSDICFEIKILPNLVLDYLVALYPFALTVISYFLVVLYNKNYKIITFIWSPFRYIFIIFRRNWDIKTSLIDAYATFFLLSSTKFLGVSFSLLLPTKVYHLHQNGSTQYSLNVYSAHHMEYFGKEHLPYAIIALLMLLIFFAFPVFLLALYPFKCFHKLFNRFSTKWHCIHTFMDAFHGCYKDGTEPGTRDYRWFVAVFFVARFVDFLIQSISDNYVSLILIAIALLFFTTLITVIRPFKSPSHNKINIAFLNILTALSISIIASVSAPYLAPQFTRLFYISSAILGSVPLLYTIGIILHKIFTASKLRLRVVKLKNKYTNLTESLPDRLSNSQDYPSENLAYFAMKEIGDETVL